MLRSKDVAKGGWAPQSKCYLALLRTNNEQVSDLGWILAEICLKCIILVTNF